MRGTLKGTTLLTALLGGAAVLAAAGLSQPAAAHDPERPDISGVWMAIATEPAARLGAMAPDLTDAGKAAVKAFEEEYGADFPEAGAHCVGTGMPYVMPSLAAYPIEVLQEPERIVMVAEMEQQVRRVYLDGRDVPSDYPRTRIGYSTGEWEGDKLVVTTTNFKEWPLGRAPRSEAMVITEEFTITTTDEVDVEPSGFVASIPAESNRLLIDRMTVEDSRFYKEPFTVTIYYREVSDDLTLEYDCPVDLWQQSLEAHKAGKGQHQH